MLGLRLCQAAEIAELGAAERLHADPRRQRDLGDVTVLRARIDRVMKTFVDLVEAIGIAGVAEDAELLVNRFETVTLASRHALGSEAGAQRLQLRHGFEHARQALDRRLRDHRTAMGPCLDQAARDQLPQRFAHRRTRDAEAPRDVGLVEWRAGRESSTHDLVGKLETQFLGARDLLHRWQSTVDTRHHRQRPGRKIVKHHTVRSLSTRR